jgi:hypothetical protein
MDDQSQIPRNLDATLAKVDQSWQAFRQVAADFPVERLNEHLGDGWTRKHMLAHIAAWHDLSSERLTKFMKDAAPHDLADHEDVINARVARAAEGRTLGEVFEALDSSFRRLRRQVSYLSDQQLGAHDGWAAAVIAGNTYGHYEEHQADLALPEA